MNPMSGRSRLFSALQRYVAREPQVAEAVPAPCELCSEPIPPEHRHLLEMDTQQAQCVCRACTILFATEAASRGKYRLIPDRYLYLEDFQIDTAQWDTLRIPVGLAFFFYSTPAQRVVAFYPGPMGATESHLDLPTWTVLETHNAVLGTLQPDVESLLVNCARGAEQYFLVPIDACYHLVGLIRSKWRGLSGGQAVWTEIERFFETLRRRSQTVKQEAFSSVDADRCEATKGDDRWRPSAT